MITVKVSGPGAGLFGAWAYRAMTEAGFKVCHWEDVASKERQPYADAREEGADVLLLEMKANA